MDNGMLRNEYAREKPLAERFLNEFIHQFGALMENAGVSLGVQLKSPVKTWESLDEKLTKNSLNISSCKELNDFIGVRS